MSPTPAAPPTQDLTPGPRTGVESVFTPATRRFLLRLLCLAIVTAVLLRGIRKGEFSENVDETVHAATGLYVVAFLHDLPLRHPVQYTYRYYAQCAGRGTLPKKSSIYDTSKQRFPRL